MILDASALLAMLRSEPGGDLVAERLTEARMSVVNHAEVISHYARLGADAAAIDAMLRPLPIELMPVSADLARAAGLLSGMTGKAGLSLGDRFCLALAKMESATAWTADRAWKRVAAPIGVEVRLIR